MYLIFPFSNIAMAAFETRKKLVGGFNPSEKYESNRMMTFLIYGKINNVSNHQPEKTQGPKTRRMKTKNHFMARSVTEASYPEVSNPI